MHQFLHVLSQTCSLNTTFQVEFGKFTLGPFGPLHLLTLPISINQKQKQKFHQGSLAALPWKGKHQMSTQQS